MKKYSFRSFLLILLMLISQMSSTYAEEILIPENREAEIHSDELPMGYLEDGNEDMPGLLTSSPEGFLRENLAQNGSFQSKEKVDLVFIIDSSLSMQPHIKHAEDNIISFAKYLNHAGISMRIGLIEYQGARDGKSFTKTHMANRSAWMDIHSFIKTLGQIRIKGGEDQDASPVDALKLLVSDNRRMHWSSGSHKFAVLLTEGIYGVDDSHGYHLLEEMGDTLQKRNIHTSVITLPEIYPVYEALTEKTNGILGNIMSDNFADVLREFADSILQTTKKSEKAIYVLPGYLGSELYDDYGRGQRLWVDILTVTGSWSQGNKNKFIQDEYGNPGVLGVNHFRDDYGTGNLYKKLVTRLKEEFDQGSGKSDYDVIFWPYNWIADLNDSVIKLEEDIRKNGYSEVVFVTHSTGGLLASAYVAKSPENKRRVKKAILIAAPLFGTYASLLPIERGDSRNFFKKGNKIIDAVTQNSWIKKWAHNSPTTYQLLPSQEYLDHLPLKKYPFAKMKTVKIGSSKKFYETLNRSVNINANLSDGTNRSHKYFRETVLHKDVASQWAESPLAELDVLLIGTENGHKTPSTALYREIMYGQQTFIDMKYDSNGDGTVQGFSAKAKKKGSTFQLPEKFSFREEHTALVKENRVLNAICKKIAEGREGRRASYTPSDAQVAPAQAAENGMSDSLKIRYEAEAPVEVRIYDESGKEVAHADRKDYDGFDGGDFIYDSFSDEEWKPLVSIYMPRRGYKLVLTSGNAEGVPVNLSITTSTLTPDGDFDVSVRQVVPLTQKGGVIATIDGTEEPILSENIADKLAGEVTRYYTDWTGEEVLRMNLHEKRQTPITGKEAEAVRPLLHYDTSDETIVSVSEEGLLTATGYGEAIVYASDGNKVYSSLVIVMRKADSVSLPDVDMVIGERTLIRPHFTPASTTEREMHYTVSEEGILEINEQGVMLALRPGVVRVTGTTDYGLTGSFTVQVTDDRIRPLDSIEILPSKASILTGENKVLSIQFFPSDATNQEVEWYVEDEDILSLTAEGAKAVVTGLREGTGKITALSMDGGYVAEAVIHVKNPASPVNPPAPPTTPPAPTVRYRDWESKYGVSTDKKWTVVLNQSIDENCLQEDIISVLRNDGSMRRHPLRLSLSDDGRKLTVTPLSPYEKRSEYQLLIRNLKTKSGKKLRENIRMTFITGE